MAANSAIEWTEKTWNPLVGCTRISPGCQHCYAEKMSMRLASMARHHPDAADRKRHYLNVIDEHGQTREKGMGDKPSGPVPGSQGGVLLQAMGRHEQESCGSGT